MNVLFGSSARAESEPPEPAATVMAVPDAKPEPLVLGDSGLASPALYAAAPDLALGVVFLITWIAPTAFGAHLFGYLMLMMAFEFIVVHSSAFMGSVIVGTANRRGKVIALAGLGGFYTLFAGALAFALHTLWPLFSFWGLTLNRMLSVIVGQAPSGEEKAFVMKSWAVSVLFYMLGCLATTLLPVPRFGVTPEVIASQHLPGTGLWISQPWRVLAFGFIYFTAVGISELFGHRWLKAQVIARSR